MRKDIISEVINKYIENKCMLKEYRNPNDADIVRQCGDILQQLYNNTVGNGMSKREITVEVMARIIGELRHLEKMMR